MYFLFVFKAKPPCSRRLSERFFLPFNFTTEEAGSVPKISSCNSSHQSLISFPGNLVTEALVYGEGTFLGPDPSLYGGTTVWEGTVEPVSSLPQFTHKAHRLALSKEWMQQAEVFQDKWSVRSSPNTSAYRPVSSSGNSSPLPLEIKPLEYLAINLWA